MGLTGFLPRKEPPIRSILLFSGLITIAPLATETITCVGFSSFSILRTATGICTCHLEVILTVCIVLLIIQQYNIFCKNLMRFVEDDRTGPHHSFERITDSLHSDSASLNSKKRKVVRASLRFGVNLNRSNFDLAGELNSGSFIAREN